MHQRSGSAKLNRGIVIVERFPNAWSSTYRPLFKDVFLDVLHLSHLVFRQYHHLLRLFTFGSFDPLFFEFFHIYFDLLKLFVSLVSFLRTTVLEHYFDFSHLLKLDLRTFFNYSFKLLLVLVLHLFLLLLVLLPHLVDFLLDVFFIILQILLVEHVRGVRLGIIESTTSFPYVPVHSGRV